MGDDRKQLNALLMEATEKLEMAAQLIRYLGLDHGKNLYMLCEALASVSEIQHELFEEQSNL